MTATTLANPATRPTTITAPTTRRVWRTGAVAGIAASAATAGAAGVAHALGVPLTVGGKAIPVLGFAQVTFVATIIGTVIAAVLARRTTRPTRAFLTTTSALTLLSFVPDVTADAHTATRVTLALTHVIAAAIVIPALASRLSD